MTTMDTTLATIRARRAEIDPRKVALLVLIALPVALGWVARKVCLAAWVVVTFVWVAAQQGWKAGAAKSEDGG